MFTLKKNKQSISISKYNPTHEQKRLTSKSPKFFMQNIEAEQQLKSSIKEIANLNDKNLIESIRERDFQESLKILHRIQAIISECSYNTNKKLYYSHLSIYYNNLAYVYSEMQLDDECCKMMEKSVKNYEMIHGYLMSREEHIAHANAYVKLSLKYCAVLSHNQRHLQSMSIAEKCIQKISESIATLDAICNDNIVSARDTPETVATESDSRIRSEAVNFKKIVIRQAEKLLKDIGDLPSTYKLYNEQKDHFQQKLKNMYFWKNNIDNNVKNIKKSFNSKQDHQNSQRNLLGLQKSSNFTEQFSLSDLMSMDFKKMKMKLNTDMYFLLSSPKIIELILMASVCYFTIATETRFSEGSLDVTILKINEKYKKLHKDEKIKKCKISHLKALELAGKFLSPQNDFLTHLINSFNKNYKCIMDEIKQESEISIKSIKNQINETYYHQLDQSSKLTDSYATNALAKTKKKRSVSKDKNVVGVTKKKVRSNSGFKNF